MDRLAAMQTFVRVAEAGSFTAVADQMDVARSAITRQIAALEAHLGRQVDRAQHTAAVADSAGRPTSSNAASSSTASTRPRAAWPASDRPCAAPYVPRCRSASACCI
jgi:hypothetical protein